MSFSTATITHTYENADGTPASGQVKFTLTRAITNGSITIVPASITAALSSSGVLSQALTANNDSGTFPTDSQWQVYVEILGAKVEEYTILVPTGGGSIDLGTLLPSAQQVN